MRKSLIITGLDIGSSKVSSVAGEITPDGTFKIIAQVTSPSRGVSRGAVEDLNEATDVVSKTIARLRDKIRRRPDNIYVNINGTTIKGERAKGMIPLSLRGREITRPDMERCVNVASTINLPLEREIIHKIPQAFSIDDQPPVKNPLGLSASRLTCEVYVITANINHIQNIYKCVAGSGYDVREAVFTGIAAGAAILGADDKREGGVMLLDMGNSVTGVSIFLNGSLNDLDIIPLGAKDVKGDPKESAEFNGILARIDSTARRSSDRGVKINSVTLTGGMTFTDSVVEALEAKLPYPVRMGAVRSVRGEISSVESIRAATAIGLARYGCEKIKRRAIEGKNLINRLSNKVVDIFNNYF